MYLLISFYIILFFLAFRYLNVFKINSLPPWVLPLAFLIKICIGGFYLTLYLHPDTNNLLPSDTMNYLNESKIVNRVFYESPKDYFYLLSGTGDDNYLIPKYLSNTFVWDSGSINIVNDSRNIIRLNSLIQFISFGIPFIHTLFMCFISLIGLRHLFLTFENLTNINPLLFFSLLFFLPSLLFWTSGILKEPILFFGLSIFTRSLLKKDAFKKRFFFGCIGVLILLGIKPYVIASLLLSIFYFILYKYIFKEKIVASCIGFTLCLLISLTFFSTLRQKITVHLAKKQFDFDNVGKGGFYVNDNEYQLYFSIQEFKKLKISSDRKYVEIIRPTKCQRIAFADKKPLYNLTALPDGKKRKIDYNLGGALSYIKTKPINDSFKQLIKNIPEALVNSVLRPFPNDPGSSLKFPAMFENWIIILLLIVILFHRKKIDNHRKAIIISLSIFATTILLIIGWTIPIIGAIYRYRLPAQIAILLIIAILFKPIHLISKKSDSK